MSLLLSNLLPLVPYITHQSPLPSDVRLWNKRHFRKPMAVYYGHYIRRYTSRVFSRLRRKRKRFARCRCCRLIGYAQCSCISHQSPWPCDFRLWNERHFRKPMRNLRCVTLNVTLASRSLKRYHGGQFEFLEEVDFLEEAFFVWRRCSFGGSGTHVATYFYDFCCFWYVSRVTVTCV